MGDSWTAAKWADLVYVCELLMDEEEDRGISPCLLSFTSGASVPVRSLRIGPQARL